MCGRGQWSLITTTDHIERLWHLLKYSFLGRCTKLSVSRLIEVLLLQVNAHARRHPRGNHVFSVRFAAYVLVYYWCVDMNIL